MGKLTCQDLMVGDLVYIHKPECKGHRIDAIDELDGQVGADGEVYDYVTPCYAPNGICMNPHGDCINCPKRGDGGTWSTSINTNKED